MPLTQESRALDQLKSRGMLRLREYLAEGIEPETLAPYVGDAKVISPARGLHQLSDLQINPS
jgi:hypothetical protein